MREEHLVEGLVAGTDLLTGEGKFFATFWLALGDRRLLVDENVQAELDSECRMTSSDGESIFGIGSDFRVALTSAVNNRMDERISILSELSFL
jgi:hypothetical protein